jgi:formate dehydrogenase beta subunit
MACDRRTMLKGLAATGAAAMAGSLPAAAREKREAPEDAVGMLYDTTLCIGCKACVVACREANETPVDTRTFGDGLYDAPSDLNDYTKNIIKLYKDENTDEMSYMKAQCMHCIDPGCVGACMIGALQKREYGIVTWDPGRCIGCRYCQVACPYLIPKFEWESANPRIIKCELCHHRVIEGKEPGCCEVCPREAVIFGKYTDLVAEAQRRVAEAPEGKYFENKIYGLYDGGGTQVLYLTHIDFTKLGLPDLGDTPSPELAQKVQHGVYQGFIAPVVLYGLLGAVIFRNRRKGGAEGEGGDE